MENVESKVIYPYYAFEESVHNIKLEARFWNCQGKQIAIIASVTRYGDRGDWAAYIGADTSWTEDGTLKYVAEYGSKLSEKDARYFFPDIELPYRN